MSLPGSWVPEHQEQPRSWEVNVLRTRGLISQICDPRLRLDRKEFQAHSDITKPRSMDKANEEVHDVSSETSGTKDTTIKVLEQKLQDSSKTIANQREELTQRNALIREQADEVASLKAQLLKARKSNLRLLKDNNDNLEDIIRSGNENARLCRIVEDLTAALEEEKIAKLNYEISVMEERKRAMNRGRKRIRDGNGDHKDTAVVRKKRRAI